jgi:hypothetical protein
MALDATVKGTASNSYETEAAANTYLTTERLYISAWTSATTPMREQALIWATFLLDSNFDFSGYKRTLEQALRWPRAGAVNADGEDINYDTIPAVIKKATATLALHLLTSNRTAEPSILGLGIQEAKIGPLEVKINDLDVKEVIPDEVTAMLASVGTLKHSAAGGSASVPLLRG